MASGDNNRENVPEELPAIEGPRPPRNLQDLLRYAVESSGNSSSNNNFAPLDPEVSSLLVCLLIELKIHVVSHISILNMLY